MRGKMWRVIKEMYRVSRSAVLLDGECSEAAIYVLVKAPLRVYYGNS